jgi:hypothetical protein
MKVKISKYPKHRWYHNFLYEKLGISNDQTVSVHIDDFDTWSMDHTLAHIIVPMLKQLKETKHGSPYVYPEDVPTKLRPTKKELTAYTKDGETDSKFFERWDWVMDEMVWAFEQKCRDDWESDYTADVPTGEPAATNWEGHKAHHARMSNGFKLFGKYYESLWD